MARKLEAGFAGRYLMSSVLITSTMKSEPATPPIRGNSFGVPVSAAATCIEGGSAEGRGAGPRSVWSRRWPHSPPATSPRWLHPRPRPQRGTCGGSHRDADRLVSWDSPFECCCDCTADRQTGRSQANANRGGEHELWNEY